jgi:hypothetical protein
MRNDFGVRPGNTRFPYKGGKSVKSAPKKQTANDKLDESLGARRGKESTKTQSYKSRRDESRGSK